MVEISEVPNICLKEFTKSTLRITSQIIKIKGTFVKDIFKYSPSFMATLSLVHTLFKWRHSEGAREKARRYLLRFAAPSPLEISGLRRQYRVQEKDGLVFAVTRPFLDKKGNEVSSQYTVLSPDSEITRKILTDGHQHGEGIISA